MLKYRADIDGLRALAVSAVVAFHAGLPGVSGGFAGVDVFFVISGFLITGLLLSERASFNRIDLFGFWVRRARRLAPAVLYISPDRCPVEEGKAIYSDDDHVTRSYSEMQVPNFVSATALLMFRDNGGSSLRSSGATRSVQ